MWWGHLRDHIGLRLYHNPDIVEIYGGVHWHSIPVSLDRINFSLRYFMWGDFLIFRGWAMRATGTFLAWIWSYFRTLWRQLLLFINQIVANCLLFLLLIMIIMVMENLLAVLLSETARPLHILSPLLYLIVVASLSICSFEVFLCQHRVSLLRMLLQ